MTKSFRVRRFNARSFSQITLDRSEEHSLAEELYDVRRIARIIAPALRGFPIGIDFTQMGHIRRKDGVIYLFVHSSVQRTKLRQILPRLEDLIHAAGYRDSMEIKILAQKPVIELRKNHAVGVPRRGDLKASADMMKAAQDMPDSALKEALEKLAATLQK